MRPAFARSRHTNPSCTRTNFKTTNRKENTRRASGAEHQTLTREQRPGLVGEREQRPEHQHTHTHTRAPSRTSTRSSIAKIDSEQPHNKTPNPPLSLHSFSHTSRLNGRPLAAFRTTRARHHEAGGKKCIYHTKLTFRARQQTRTKPTTTCHKTAYRYMFIPQLFYYCCTALHSHWSTKYPPPHTKTPSPFVRGEC